MRYFRKIRPVILCLLCLTFLLAGCGETPESSPSGKAEEAEYAMVYNQVRIQPGEAAAPVLSRLPAYRSFEESGSCAADGKDKKYTYDSFCIETVHHKDADVISAVYFLNDLVETPEGVTIGQTEAEVTAAMGAPTGTVNGNYIYEGKTTECRILFKDGTVSGVQYLIKDGPSQ